MGPLGGLGIGEIILIFIVVLLLFGAKRIPEIGSALGKGIREFKGSLRDIEGEIKGEESKRTPPPSSQPREVSAPRRAEGEGASDRGGRGSGAGASAEPDVEAPTDPARPDEDTGEDTGEADEGERRTLTTSD